MRCLVFYSLVSLFSAWPVAAAESILFVPQVCVDAFKTYRAQTPGWPLWSDAKGKLEALQRGELVPLGDCVVQVEQETR